MGRDADLIVIDENPLGEWLKPLAITVGDLDAMSTQYAGPDETDLLQALRRLLIDLNGGHLDVESLNGRRLYGELDRLLRVDLSQVLPAARAAFSANRLKMLAAIPALPEARLDSLAPNYREALYDVLTDEVDRWARGEDFNPRLHLVRPYSGPGDHKPAVVQLGRVRRPRFLDDPNHAPGVILDGTCDRATLEAVLGKPVEVWRANIEVPECVHVWLTEDSTGYGRTRLGYDADRRHAVIRRAACLLREVNPEGIRSVGLVAPRNIVDQVGKALGIPDHRRLYYGDLRGTNKIRDCDVLLVLGNTQEAQLDVVRRAQALYWDGALIDPTATKGEDGIYRYADERVQRLMEHAREAETMQAVFRTRLLAATTRKDVVLLSRVPVSLEAQHVHVVEQFETLDDSILTGAHIPGSLGIRAEGEEVEAA